MQEKENRVGQRLGNYRLTRLLGEGGFAEVYLGEHVHLETQAAIKVLHARLARNDVETFRAEARMIARLVHPHIVRVLEFGVEDNTPFLVMDYAAGGTLRQQYPQGKRLPLEMIVSYTQQIAEALQYAHDKKVIHRDVKPENMLLGRDQQVLLSDFGIAVAAQSSLDESPQGTGGTVAYMAPEQIQGRPRPASDQYALGVVVYEWLCGERPFRGSFTELCTQHMFAKPPSLREKLPTIPPEVERVVMTALAKDPAQRFRDVRAFATALQRASRAGEDSFQVSSDEEAPATSQSGGSLIAALVEETPPTVLKERIPSGVLEELISSGEMKAHTPSTKPEEHLSSADLDIVPKRSRKRLGRRAMIAGLAGLASVGTGLIWFVTSRGASPSTPVSTPSARASSTRSALTPSASASSVGSMRVIYEGHTDVLKAIAWSPDGKWIASGSNDKTVQVWDAAKGTHIFTYTGHTDVVHTIAWSLDGKRIASGSYDKTVRIWDAFSGDHVFTYNGHGNLVEAIAWSLPDGKKLAVTGVRTMEVLNATDGTQVVTYQRGLGAAKAVAWSPPDGRRIASSGGNAVYIWNAADGKQIAYYDKHTDRVDTLAWSPLDGKRIASGGKDKTVQVWNAADGSPVFTYHGHTEYVNTVAWSPDGKRIASVSDDDTVQVWNAADGSPVFIYHGHSSDVNVATWSPDGRWIASGGDGGNVRVWRIG